MVFGSLIAPYFGALWGTENKRQISKGEDAYDESLYRDEVQIPSLIVTVNYGNQDNEQVSSKYQIEPITDFDDFILNIPYAIASRLFNMEDSDHLTDEESAWVKKWPVYRPKATPKWLDGLQAFRRIKEEIENEPERRQAIIDLVNSDASFTLKFLHKRNLTEESLEDFLLNWLPSTKRREPLYVELKELKQTGLKPDRVLILWNAGYQRLSQLKKASIDELKTIKGLTRNDHKILKEFLGLA